ncbi:uncharacterized protein LOC124652622 isoform X2 [Lolium rigidum]|nr:uncharacterized protein LOC124652622 isoform X2 [Lolium rigidum]
MSKLFLLNKGTCYQYLHLGQQLDVQLAWRGPGPAVDGFGSSGAPVVLSAVCPCCRVMVTSSPWQQWTLLRIHGIGPSVAAWMLIPSFCTTLKGEQRGVILTCSTSRDTKHKRPTPEKVMACQCLSAVRGSLRFLQCARRNKVQLMSHPSYLVFGEMCCRTNPSCS